MLGRPCPPCSAHQARLALALAALGLVLLVPGWGRASCGQYVELNGQPSTGKIAAGHPVPSGASLPAPAKPTCPCKGPRCSQGPARAPAVPVVPPTFGGERWAAFASSLDVPTPDGTQRDATTDTVRGTYRTSPPDPPPRLLPS